MKRSVLGRRFRGAGILLAAAAVIGALVLPAGAGIAAADDYDCKAGAVVVVPGTFDTGGGVMVGVGQRYRGEKPILVDGKVVIVDDTASPYYGPDKQYKILYAHYPTMLWPAGSPGYDADVALGVEATEYQVAEYQKNCPGKEVVIAGYSQGARIAGDVLSDIGNGRTEPVLVDGEEVTISAANVRGELYSDPRRDGPESGRGIELSLLGLLPGLTMSGPRQGGFGTVPVTQYCLEGDLVCDLPDPLHDPFGVIDGIVAYFNKHNYYPTRMFADVSNSNVWKCDTTAVNGYVDCVVSAPSAISMLGQDVADRVLGALGLGPVEVFDFWSLLPDVNGIFPHANLSDLQKYLNPILALAPQWPDLRYGGYLPDLFMFRDVLTALTSLDGQALIDSLKVIGGSAMSIALMPVRFVEHWGKELAKVITPRETAEPAVVLASVESQDDDAHDPDEVPSVWAGQVPEAGAADEPLQAELGTAETSSSGESAPELGSSEQGLPEQGSPELGAPEQGSPELGTSDSGSSESGSSEPDSPTDTSADEAPAELG
ncbi:cutinase family protein [Gordonia caeni]|uniref:PE-PPE domain-containing protein n=1 Tax=Gordonia caeni TaxID=1007097 RepID=A0ABP7P875_9ACTN